MRTWPPRHRSRPTDRSHRLVLLARVLAGVTVLSFAIGLVFTFLAASIRPPGAGDPLGDIVFVLSFAMFPVIGYVLATRRPENSIGWLMLGIGTFFGLTAILTSLGEYLLYSGRPGHRPRADRVRFAQLGPDRGAARHVPPPAVPGRASAVAAVAMVRVVARRRAGGDLPLDPARSGSDGGVDRSDGAEPARDRGARSVPRRCAGADPRDPHRGDRIADRRSSSVSGGRAGSSGSSCGGCSPPRSSWRCSMPAR